MLTAKQIKKIADSINEEKNIALRKFLKNIYCDIIAETENKIQYEANEGKYETKTPDINEKLNLGAGKQLISEGYTETEITSCLTRMLQEYFIKNGFYVKNVISSNDRLSISVRWG